MARMHKPNTPDKMVDFKLVDDMLEEKKTPASKLKQEQEWREVEELVMQYQEQFKCPNNTEIKEIADKAMIELLERFYPLFKKYIILIKSGQINFNDAETRKFLITFMVDATSKRALKQKHVASDKRANIYHRFNFIKEIYGRVEEEEMLCDLQLCFMTLANRYKQMGRNYCAYVYNAFYHEVSRMIKKYIENPQNIHYRNSEYEDYMQNEFDEIQQIETPIEEKIFLTEDGIPSYEWIQGDNCDSAFAELDATDRKILVLFYLERFTDKQISQQLGMSQKEVKERRINSAKWISILLGMTH